MFGISFGELVIIGIVGLIVIGPERLPAVARTLGSLLRQVQDYTNAFKTELNRELHNAEILKLEQEMKAEGRNLQVGLTEEFSQVQQELEQAAAADAALQPDWHAGNTRPAPAPATVPSLQDAVPEQTSAEDADVSPTPRGNVS